jgi:hypothetical protein
MSRQRLAIPLLLAGGAAAAVFACSSATAPANLTGPYVGTYTMDSVTTAALAKEFPPNGTLDAADGVTGTLTLKSDSFYVTLAGSFPQQDSGTFTISSGNQWTLGGTLFSGTGSGALIGSQLQLSLTGGTALGSLYGLFTKQ